MPMKDSSIAGNTGILSDMIKGLFNDVRREPHKRRLEGGVVRCGGGSVADSS